MWLYYTACTQKNQKRHSPLKAVAIRLTLLLFPMCTKPRARYQNSEPPNQRNRSRLASRSNCTHLKEISPPQYHIYIDNIFRACGKDSPDKKRRARLIYITEKNWELVLSVKIGMLSIHVLLAHGHCFEVLINTTMLFLIYLKWAFQ